MKRKEEKKRKREKEKKRKREKEKKRKREKEKKRKRKKKEKSKKEREKRLRVKEKLIWWRHKRYNIWNNGNIRNGRGKIWQLNHWSKIM